MLIIKILASSIIGYYDKNFYKIPNEILLLTAILILICRVIKMPYSFLNELTNLISIIVVSIIVWSILKIKIDIKAGDIKLFTLIIYLEGVDIGLKIIICILLSSLIPMMIGIKKVALGNSFNYIYTAFCLFKFCMEII